MIDSEGKDLKLSFNSKMNSSFTDPYLGLHSNLDVRKCHFRIRHLPFSYMTAIIVHTSSTHVTHEWVMLTNRILLTACTLVHKSTVDRKLPEEISAIFKNTADYCKLKATDPSRMKTWYNQLKSDCQYALSLDNKQCNSHEICPGLFEIISDTGLDGKSDLRRNKRLNVS